jgi:seryl-tRNA synthetase
MPEPDAKAEKKKIETAKKEIQSEVKKLVKKTKKQANEARELVQQKQDCKKKRSATPEDKKQAKEIDKKLMKVQKVYEKEAAATSKSISLMLKNYVPDDKTAVKDWQKGMDRWYVDIITREPGFDLGGGVRAIPDISVKDKKAKIDFKFSF